MRTTEKKNKERKEKIYLYTQAIEKERGDFVEFACCELLR